MNYYIDKNFYNSLENNIIKLPNDLKIHYLSYGKKLKGNILMLHGFGASAYTWRNIIKRIADEGFKVYAVDLKGAGYSDKPLQSDYSIYKQSEHILDFMKILSIKETHLIANSLGGGIALRLSLTDEKRIKSLVLIDSVCYRQDFPFYIKITQNKNLVQILFSIFSKSLLVKFVMKQAFYRSNSVSKTAIKEYANQLKQKGSLNALTLTANQIIPDDIEEFEKNISNIRIPSTIIWGKEDRVIKPEMASRLGGDLQNNSNIIILPECGHAPQEEKPEVLISHIKAFYKSIF
jgi:pimeloyl-ACP methyl ester carboxylesterase